MANAARIESGPRQCHQPELRARPFVRASVRACDHVSMPARCLRARRRACMQVWVFVCVQVLHYISLYCIALLLCCPVNLLYRKLDDLLLCYFSYWCGGGVRGFAALFDFQLLCEI